MTDRLDMTGQWHGTFAYPQNLGPATPFLCTITDTAGALGGTIIEPETMYRTGRTMNAALAGYRSGRSIDFTKGYHGQTFGYETPVDYVGQLSADGTAATGVWSLLDMNGSFEMYRDPSAEALAQVDEEAGQPVERV